MTAHLLRSVAESAATPAFGHNRATISCTTAAALGNSPQRSLVAPSDQQILPTASATTPPSATSSDAEATAHQTTVVPSNDQLPADSPPSPLRRSLARQRTAAPPAAAATTRSMAHAPQADDYLRPVFTSWSQARAAIAQRLTLLRHTLGLIPRNQHVLHLPCRHSGAIYRLPVALITNGVGTHIVPTSTSAGGSGDPMDPSWMADAQAARFVVLARGNQQRIVEVQPANADLDSGNRLLVLPDRARAHPRDASPFVSTTAFVTTFATTLAPVAIQHRRFISPTV